MLVRLLISVGVYSYFHYFKVVYPTFDTELTVGILLKIFGLGELALYNISVDLFSVL